MYLMQTVSAVPRGRPSSSMDVRVALEKHHHGSSIEELKNYRNVNYEGRIGPNNGLDKRRIEVEDEEKDKKKEKKWTLGGFFRRKGKKEADESSEEEEEGKKGFLSRKRSSRRKRKSVANGFDVVVPPHSLVTVRKTAEDLWADPNDTQQRYIFRQHDVRQESNLSRNSGGGSGSLDGRKGRREMMARAQAKRDQMCDGSSSEDNESGASTSSVSREGRKRRPGRPKIPSATPSPSRSPRVQPKHPLHGSSSYPLPVHTYPPGYHWDVGAFTPQRRTPQEYEHFLSTCGSRNKSLSFDQDMHRAEAMFIQLPIARTRSSCIQAEAHGEVPNLKPEPPPRAHAVACRFDSTSSLPLQPQSLIKRSSSGNSFIYMYENVQDPYQHRSSSYQHIYQNCRVPNGAAKSTTQHKEGPRSNYYWNPSGNAQKLAIPPQNDLRYYADQNPRSRNPIHITCGNPNPSPTGDSSCLSDSQISRRSTKEFWRQKDKQLMMQQVSQQQKSQQMRDPRSRSNSPLTSGITHKPKSKQSAVVVTRNVTHAVPSLINSSILPSPSLSEDRVRIKSPPEPPLRRRSKLEDTPPYFVSETSEKSTSNLDDALNELETIYKSLRLAEEHGTPVKQKPACPKPPDIIADDMAKRRLNPKEPFDQNKKLVQQSYLQCSPALSGTPSESPIPLKPTSPSEPDVMLDDVVFRSFRQANSKLKTPDPQPPFGIPLGPVAPAAQSDYLHINPAEKFRSSFIASKVPDIVKDDLAFRNLRKDGVSTNFPVVNYNGKSSTKKRAVRSLSENLFNLLQKEGNGFLPIETNNNLVGNELDKTHSMTDLNDNVQRDCDILEQRLKALKEEKLAKRAEFFEDNLKPALPVDLRRSTSNTDSRQKSTSTETLTEECDTRKIRQNVHKKVGNSLSVDSKLQAPPAPERRHFRSPIVELSKYPAAVPAAALYSNPFKEEPTPLDEFQLDDLLSTIAKEAKITSEAIGRQLVELEVAAASDMLSSEKKDKSKLSKLSAEFSPSKCKKEPGKEPPRSPSFGTDSTDRIKSSCSVSVSPIATEMSPPMVKRACSVEVTTLPALKPEKAVIVDPVSPPSKISAHGGKTSSLSPKQPSPESRTDVIEDVTSIIKKLEKRSMCLDSQSPPKPALALNLSQLLLDVEKEHLELTKKIMPDAKAPSSPEKATGRHFSVPYLNNQSNGCGSVRNEHSGDAKFVNCRGITEDSINQSNGTDKTDIIQKDFQIEDECGDAVRRLNSVIECKSFQFPVGENPFYQGRSSPIHEPLSSFSSDVTVLETRMEEVPSTAVMVTILNPSSPEQEENFEPVSDFSEIVDSEEPEDSKLDVFETVYQYNCSLRNGRIPKPTHHDETDDANEEVKRIMTSRVRDEENSSEKMKRYTPRREDNLPRGVSPRGQGNGSGGDMSGVRRNAGDGISSNGPTSNSSENARQRMERYKEKRRQELSAKYGPRSAGSSSDSSPRNFRQRGEKTDLPAAAATLKKTEITTGVGVTKKTDSAAEGRLSSERESTPSPVAWGVRETKASRLRAASRSAGKSEPEKPVRKESIDKSSMRKSLLNRQQTPTPESSSSATSAGASGIRRKSGIHSTSASPTMNGLTAIRDQTHSSNNSLDRRLQRPILASIAKHPTHDESLTPPPVRTKKLPEAPVEIQEQPLVKPSILKKKSVEEAPTVNGISTRPISILKRKTLSQDGAVTFSPSVVEKEQTRKKQGILKKRRSLDESEVARRRSSSPDKSILKNKRRSSMEELTSILKRDSSENVTVSEQPQGILKRKTSTPTPAVQQHVTIAESVIMAAAAALNDFVPIDGVRPILKKKSSSEEHTPELTCGEAPRPILKKKSVETDDMPSAKPAGILKSSRKSSTEELPVVPILKRTEGGDADEDGILRRSCCRERARSAPPSRPCSFAERGANMENFVQRESHRSPPPPMPTSGSAEDFSPPSVSSGDAEVFVEVHDAEVEEVQLLEASAVDPADCQETKVELMEKPSEVRSSAVTRLRDRKLRESSRFHTQPISAELVEAAAQQKSAEAASGKEDVTEDELSKLSLGERVRLFNTRIQEAGAGPPPPLLGRRPRSARFKTQPITDEERSQAQILRAGSNGGEIQQPPPLIPSLSVRRGILKHNSGNVAVDSEDMNKNAVNGVVPNLKLKLPTGRPNGIPLNNLRGSEGQNLAKILQSVNKEAAALIQNKGNSTLVKSQSHSAVSSVLRKSGRTATNVEDEPSGTEEEKVAPVDIMGGLRRSTTQPLKQLYQENEEDDLSGLSIKERLAKLRTSGEVGWQKRKMKMKNQDEVSVITTGNYLFNGFGTPDSPSILASRLDQLDTAREGWKSRVPQTDAVQFTVEGKMGCKASKTGVSTPTNGERTKRSPKQVRFRSRFFSPLLKSTPASPQPGPTLTRSLSAPNHEDMPCESSPPAILGPTVPIPRADDETFMSFFQSLVPIPDNERLELKDDDLDALQRTETTLLVQRRTVQVQRRSRHVRNPIKSLAQRSDLQDEYIEVKTGVAERELRRMKMERLTRGTSLAVEALAGLASREDFTAVNLKKPVAAFVQYPETMLLKIKGRRNVQTRLVEPVPSNVNKGDCFLLVTRNLAAMYIGELSNVVERARAKDVAARVEAGDLACAAGRVSGEGRFWAELGGEPCEAGPPDEDERLEASLIAANIVYELVDHELVPVSSAWGTMPKVEILDPFKNLVFDFGSEMYVWSGKSAALSGRREASNLAKELWDEGYDYSDCETSPLGASKGSERPSWALFCKVTQNMEPILFKEKFQDWPDEAMLKRQLGFSEVDGSTLMEIQPCDASRMIKEHPPWPDLELEGTHLGRGVAWLDEDTRRWSEVSTVKVSVWRVTEYEHNEVEDERSIAQFFDNGSYVIRWHYSVSVNVRGLNGEPSKHVTSPGRDRYAYFLWQGRHSTPGDRGAAAVLTVSLDSENAPQMVVPQHAEPPALLQLFGGIMTVHSREEQTNSLYLIRGVEAGEAMLLEVEVAMKSLRSRACFLLVDRQTKAVTFWSGCRVTKSYKQLAKESAQKVLKLRPPEYRLPDICELIEEEEGNESDETLVTISGSRDDYFSLLDHPESSESTPRLFHFASTSGEFSVVNLSSPLLHPELPSPYPFLQSDLYSVSQPAVFLLDAGSELWVWQGWAEENSAPSAVVRYQAEKRAALQTAFEYWEQTRGDAPTKGSLVWAGLEPNAFTCLFPFWEVWQDVQELNLKETQRAVGETVDMETELKRLTCNRYPLEVLMQRPLPDGVDPTNLEDYLEPKAFPDIFELTKEEFMELPPWKKTSLKKEAGLF